MYYHFGSVHFIVELSLVGSEHILVHFCSTVYREPQISVLREFRIKKKTCFSYVTIFSEIADHYILLLLFKTVLQQNPSGTCSTAHTKTSHWTAVQQEFTPSCTLAKQKAFGLWSCLFFNLPQILRWGENNGSADLEVTTWGTTEIIILAIVRETSPQPSSFSLKGIM